MLGSKKTGDANKYCLIFTRDLGLIGATVQGIRFSKSKLRYSLQDFSYADVSVVRGKEVWRVTSASQVLSLYDSFKNNKAVLDVVVRILSLVRRLVRGEEKNERLFETLERTFSFVGQNELKKEELAGFESAAVVKILDALGYGPGDPVFAEVSEKPYSSELISFVHAHRKALLLLVNASIKESQL